MHPSQNQDTQIIHFRKKIQSCYTKIIKYICHNIHYQIPLKQGIYNVFYIKKSQAFVCIFSNYKLITDCAQSWNDVKKKSKITPKKPKNKNKNSCCFQLGQTINNSNYLSSYKSERCRNAAARFHFLSTIWQNLVYFFHPLEGLISHDDHKKNFTVATILEYLGEERIHNIFIFIILYKGKGLCEYLWSKMRKEVG